jgi:hypothetical protein
VKSWHNLLLACALLAPMALFAEPAVQNDKDAGKKPATPDAKTTSDADKEDRMLVSLPAGQTYHGVHIPNYSPSGKLLMLFDASSAKRISDREIEMQDLKIEIHNNDGSTFHVEMQHSVFNLDTRILTGGPATIKRQDFVINGDKAEFHLKTKFGRIIGPNKMTINSENTK